MRRHLLASSPFLGSLASLFVAALLAGGIVASAACGSRTGLLASDQGGTGPGAGSGRDAALDGPLHIDAASRLDGSTRTNCPDAGGTLIYVVTEENDLYSFYPPDLAFTRIGAIACPSSGTPFSMTVDRKGTAYVLFDDGSLFRVSTANASCTATSFVPNQFGFATFGMGYAANTNDNGETLFIAQDNVGTTGASNLGTIDTTSFKVGVVGPFTPSIPRAELTGTGDGRLFAWAPNDAVGATGSHLYEVDKTSGKILAENTLAAGTYQDAFAFAYWGGLFWIFDSPSPSGSTSVTRYDPATGSETVATTLSGRVVGAGVSTCAPDR